MSKHAIIFDSELGVTKQSFKDETNINLIMEKFQKTGAITHFAKNAPQYGDTQSPQLHEAMTIVADAETMFEELPSSIRKKFKNDPGLFLDFVQNPENLEEMRKLGLANKQTPTVAEQKQSESSPASTDSVKKPKADTETKKTEKPATG